MTSFDFQTFAYGKWILAGEHAVLRGHPALVFPIACKKICLRYNSSPTVLSANFEGLHGDALHLLFWSVLEHGLRLLDRALNQIKGEFILSNTIPIGVGMGASAALCVVVARWFVYQGWLDDSQQFVFSKTLEDLFHGKSSGLDIVGVSSQTGMIFQNGHAEPLLQVWQPKWCLSSCGQQGLTSPCIAKVETLWEKQFEFARAIDGRMLESVHQAQRALAQSSDEALPLLVESVEAAGCCFVEWGLVSETMTSHIQHLRALGALAVKPTGSGGGGYVLSLWADYPALINGCDEWIRI